MLLLPASIATLGMTGNILRAAWPPELWSVIRGIGQRDYLVLVTAIPGLALLFLALGHYGASPWMLISGGNCHFYSLFSLVGVFYTNTATSSASNTAPSRSRSPSAPRGSTPASAIA